MRSYQANYQVETIDGKIQITCKDCLDFMVLTVEEADDLIILVDNAIREITNKNEDSR